MRYKPAVTNVEECTREEIGVGAAIAAGSQGEKGNRALFVIRPKTNTMHTDKERGEEKTKAKKEE